MEQAVFTCSPPCHINIPPWTGQPVPSTTTCSLPAMERGRAPITKASLTITDLIFEAVTLTQGSGNGKLKRQGFEAFMPTPATTRFWPSVVYTGPDGKATTTTPTAVFPTPPSSIGPGAPPPAKGSWPKRDIMPYQGELEYPVVMECAYWDPYCYQDKPWMYGNETDSGGSFDPIDDNWEDLQTVCPRASSSSKTTTTRPTTTKPVDEPTASP